MEANATYWFNSSMNHLVQNANESGEIIPRIKVFLRKQGDINSKDAFGNTLLSKAQTAHLFRVVDYLKSQGAKSETLAETVEKTCVICQEKIHSEPAHKEEFER